MPVTYLSVSEPRSVLDRPWRRPGRLAYAGERLRGIVRPPVTIQPAPAGIVVLNDEPVVVRDGTVLRANVFLPDPAQAGEGPFPVILCAHPYGKDRLPRLQRGRWRLDVQYHAMRQTEPLAFSELTSWESPDPAFWTAEGYALVNLDVRGAGHSEGVGALLSAQEGRDIADAVQWAAAQPWSTGAVGMLGVSYLAISQYEAAAQQPEALRAIAPWEGFTDAYRDLFTPGGIPERGFSRLWTTIAERASRVSESIGRRRAAHPLRDAWWQAMVPGLERIEVPLLVCTSFSDSALHSRGSFRAFARAASAQRHAYTHRGGKWATFYSAEAKQAQRRFFARHLKGEQSAELPPVRLEVRESRAVVAQLREENEWPLARTRWTELHLGPEGLQPEPPGRPVRATFDARRRALAFDHVFDQDTELTGPMSLRLRIGIDRGDDVDLFVGVEKRDAEDRFVPFEGSYGYGRDLVARGWLRASLRRLDPEQSAVGLPVQAFTGREPLSPGRPVDVEIGLSESSTLFRAGERLRLLVSGRQLGPRNPLFGQFPSLYRASAPVRLTVHCGGTAASVLTVPVIPPPA